MEDEIINALESILSNDESSSDEELIEFFKDEFKLSDAEAENWIGKRNFYLNHIVTDDETAKRLRRLKMVVGRSELKKE